MMFALLYHLGSAPGILTIHVKSADGPCSHWTPVGLCSHLAPLKRSISFYPLTSLFSTLFSKKNAWQSHFTQSLFCWVEHGRNMTEGAPTGALHQCGLQGSLCLCFAALHQDLWVQLPGRVRGVLLTFRHNLYISLKKESMRWNINTI